MTPKAAYEIRMIGILSLMFGFVFFDRNAMGNLAPFITASLHLTNGQIGALSSGLSICWAISGFAIGTLSDALGRRKSLLLITVVIFSVSSVVSGLAPSFGVLLASRMLMGLAEGPIMPICQSLVALESAPEHRGRNMGVMQNLGSNLIGSFLGAPSFSLRWRSTSAGAAHSSWPLCRPDLRGIDLDVYPRTCQGCRSRRTPLPPWARMPHRPPPSSAAATLKQALGYRNMWICILLSMVMVPWMILGWTFLPTIYGSLRHLSHSETSWLVGVLGISAAVFAFIVPGLSDRDRAQARHDHVHVHRHLLSAGGAVLPRLLVDTGAAGIPSVVRQRHVPRCSWRPFPRRRCPHGISRRHLAWSWDWVS